MIYVILSWVQNIPSVPSPSSVIEIFKILVQAEFAGKLLVQFFCIPRPYNTAAQLKGAGFYLHCIHKAQTAIIHQPPMQNFFKGGPILSHVN